MELFTLVDAEITHQVSEPSVESNRETVGVLARRRFRSSKIESITETSNRSRGAVVTAMRLVLVVTENGRRYETFQLTQ